VSRRGQGKVTEIDLPLGYLLETLRGNFKAGDMDSEEIERLEREKWVRVVQFLF